ncbi:MAG: GNAT family N-acetyltransferase, partial [Bacteroidota bacterium]
MFFKEIILDPTHDSLIESFLDNLSRTNESILGYHYPFYRKILENIGVGEALYVGQIDQNNNLSAILPGFIKSSDLGTVYSSLPFFSPNASIICDYNSTIYKEIHRSLYDFLLNHLKNYEMISASFCTPFNAYKIMPVYNEYFRKSFIVNKFTSYLKLNEFKLNPGLEYDIRKAIKSGVIISSEIKANDIDIIYEIYYNNCMDYG